MAWWHHRRTAGALAAIMLLSTSAVSAFATLPMVGLKGLQSRQRIVSSPEKRQAFFAPVSKHQRQNQHLFMAGNGIQVLEMASQNAKSIMSSSLFEYFLQTFISNGVPAFFIIVTLAFVFSRLGRLRNRDDLDENEFIVEELYEDLYGNEDVRQGGRRSLLSALSPPRRKKIRNLGIPKEEYLKIDHINARYDSYEYSLTAATKSKAAAAALFRSKSFDRALKIAMMEGGEELPRYVKAKLLGIEKQFLKRGTTLLEQLEPLQFMLVEDAIDREMKSAGVQLALDPDPLNKTQIEKLTNDTFDESQNVSISMLNIKNNDVSKSQALQTVSKIQRELVMLELNFVAKVVSAVGSERALAVRTALLGDIAARGTGALLTQLQERPLSALLESFVSKPKNVFVARFPGDTTASQVEDLREEVTAIVRNAKPGDEVLLVLQTGGGTVTGYGLAASQLLRIKEAGLKLTIAVEQVAASGGYMMCCIADHIVASPFAVLGSIGVISDIPNVYERLKKEGIEFQTVTAGKYKRTLTPTKKVTKEDVDKSKEEVEEILALFRDFVKQNRPQLDIESVATGETWFGTAALEKGLCDEIKSVDDVIVEYVNAGCDVYEVEYDPPFEIGDFPFAFAGAEGSDSNSDAGIGGLIRRSIRWAVRAIVNEVRAELGDAAKSSNKIERRYMARDDTMDRTFFK